MCLQTRESFSNGRYFNRYHMQRYVLNTPCGQCAECRQAKRTEWYIRNYFQLKECVDNGGFGLFESWTYADEHLPHVSDFCEGVVASSDEDFTCVSKTDIQDFLDRLHTNLDYRYFGANFGLSHFIVAEYGHDNVYVDDFGKMRKGTVRPHYHGDIYVRKSKVKVQFEVRKYTKRAIRFLGQYLQQHRREFPEGIHFDGEQIYSFFRGKRVNWKRTMLERYFPYGVYEVVQEITPYDLAWEICKAWQKGNTDNFKRYALSGVLLRFPHVGAHLAYNTVGRGNRISDSDIRKVTNYISKYVSKDNTEYFPMLRYRAMQVARARVLDKWLPDASERLRANLVRIAHLYYKASPLVRWRFRDMVKELVYEDDFIAELNDISRFDVDGFIRAMALFEDDDTRSDFSEVYREVRSRIGLFHLQSDGFGAYALNDSVFGSLEELESEGTIELLDASNVVVHLPAPSYYIRKHLYDFRRLSYVDESTGEVRKSNEVRWSLKPGRMDAFESITRAKVRRFVRQCNDVLCNLSPSEQDVFRALLGARSMQDYAEYVRVYKGRLSHPDFGFKPSVRQVLEFSESFSPYNEVRWCQYRGKAAVAALCYGQDTVFADGSAPWESFDSLTAILERQRRLPRRHKQEVFDKKEYLRDVFSKMK